jgi:dTDP-4-amino-4,6-dideoxygalactose transaminase
MVLTQSSAVAKNLRELRDHGSPAKYVHARIGTNSRLQAIQAAILNVKLPHLEQWNERRRANAARYDRNLADHPAIGLMSVVEGAYHTYHQYTVRICGERTRDAVLADLAAEQIFAGVHYPSPVHLQEAAKPWGYGPGDFPNAERLAREVLCLPVHPFLSEADIDRVSEVLRRVAR